MSAIDLRGDAAYVGYCGYCEPLNHRPFHNGIATNVGGDAAPKPGSSDGWHKARGVGLPNRYITSVQIDPSDPKVVYVTLAGYSRRWLPVGVLGEDNVGAGTGHVFKSTDAGDTFTDISGNLPDVPADWTVVRGGQLVVGTDIGVFISGPATSAGSGPQYQVLGSGLPTAPVFTMELKPKATPSEPDRLVVATQGRGVYTYEFKDPAGAGANSGSGTGAGAAGLTACAGSAGFRSAAVRPRGSRALFAFTRNEANPVTVDVFQSSRGRSIVKERLVARFSNRAKSFTWNGRANRRGRKVTDGYYFVRYRVAFGAGAKETDFRRVTLARSHGRLRVKSSYYRRASCDLVRSYKLERPVFGGARNRSLGLSFRLGDAASVRVTVSRGSKVLKTFKTITGVAGRTYRLRFSARHRPRGDYRVRLVATAGATKVTSTLTSRRL
jgi:hypothetical protein